MINIKSAHLKLNNTDILIKHGDCVQGMKKYLADQSVDVVVTSPPYNLGIKYKNYHDKKPLAAYLASMREWMVEIQRILKPDGSFFLNVGSSPKMPWMVEDISGVGRELFELQNRITWVKSISLNGEPARGHVKPINSPRFLNDACEFVFHFTHNADVEIDRLAIGIPFQDKSNMKRGNRGVNGDLRCGGNVWYIPYATIQNRDKQRPHPASFPMALAEKCLLLHGKEKLGIVVDPFMGIGNTAAAAAKVGATLCWGWEISEDYIAESLEIIPKLVGKENEESDLS